MFRQLHEFREGLGIVQESIVLVSNLGQEILSGTGVQLFEPSEEKLSFQRNLFSTLFMSLYTFLGFSRKDRLLLGAINHLLRTTVTSCDNLLDDESKEVLELDLPPEAHRFKSVFSLLLADRILFSLLERAVSDQSITVEQQRMIANQTLGVLAPIGAQEAREEEGVKKPVQPEEVISTAIHYKGGKLMQAPFRIAQILRQPDQRWVQIEQGLYHFGLGLQVLDDVLDLSIDLQRKNLNYLAALIAVDAARGEELLLEVKSNPESFRTPDVISNRFGPWVEKAVFRSLDEFRVGFRIIQQAGFPWNLTMAMSLAEYIYELLGAQSLLKWFEKKQRGL